MRGMDKRRKHPCVNTLNKWLPVNTFIGNLNMPSLKKVSVVWEGGGVSREQECHSHHQLSWLHLPDPAMHKHTDTHLNAIPTRTCVCTDTQIHIHTHRHISMQYQRSHCVECYLHRHCFHLPWLSKLMYKILTVVEI